MEIRFPLYIRGLHKFTSADWPNLTDESTVFGKHGGAGQIALEEILALKVFNSGDYVNADTRELESKNIADLPDGSLQVRWTLLDVEAEGYSRIDRLEVTLRGWLCGEDCNDPTDFHVETLTIEEPGAAKILAARF